MDGGAGRFIPTSVEAYAGYKADETPRAFTWEGRRIEVAEVVDRWYEAGRDPARPAASYFKVRGTDGWRCLLRQDHESRRWYVLI